MGYSHGSSELLGDGVPLLWASHRWLKIWTFMTSKSHSPRQFQHPASLPGEQVPLFRWTVGQASISPVTQRWFFLYSREEERTLNIYLQRPEILQKKNQLYHKTKLPKDLGGSEWWFQQAFKADTSLAPVASSFPTMCGGHFNMLKARRLLISLTRMSRSHLGNARKRHSIHLQFIKTLRGVPLVSMRRSESPHLLGILHFQY